MSLQTHGVARIPDSECSVEAALGGGVGNTEWLLLRGLCFDIGLSWGRVTARFNFPVFLGIEWLVPNALFILCLKAQKPLLKEASKREVRPGVSADNTNLCGRWVPSTWLGKASAPVRGQTLASQSKNASQGTLQAQPGRWWRPATTAAATRGRQRAARPFPSPSFSTAGEGGDRG